jgi:MFS transporter, DHA1 family, tetracycline resistance protein
MMPIGRPFSGSWRVPMAAQGYGLTSLHAAIAASPLAPDLSTKPLSPAIRFLLQTIFVNAIGFGIIVPVTPDLVIELGKVSVSGATAIGGWLALVYALFQFLTGPLAGNLSDRFGRRPIILGSQIGFGVEFLLMAIAPNLTWLFVARILSGVFGATQGPAQSSIADLATPDDRAKLYGWLGGAFSIGFVVGPALGGLLGEIGPRVPFVVAAALALLNALYGIWACKETLSEESRRPFEWRRANPLGALQQARKIPGILPLAVIYYLWQLASIVYPLIWNYFTKGKFGWTPGMIGGSLMLIGIFMSITNLSIAPRINKRLGERKTALIGISIGVSAMFACAFAPIGWMLFVLCAVVSLQAMVHPALTAMMSRYGNASTQGEVQGFASSVMALGAITAPILFNPLHSWFTSPDAPFRFDGAPLVLAGLIGAMAGLLLLARK